MVKSETHRDAEILVRNPSPRLFGKKFRDSKKVNTNHAKTRLRDISKTLPRFRDPAKIFRDPRFSRHHSPPLLRDYSLCLVCILLLVCSPYSAFCTQPAFYSQTAVFILHSDCILHLGAQSSSQSFHVYQSLYMHHDKH